MAACKFTIIARSFSTSGAQCQMIKTPVPVFGIGGRYASAIYSAGMKSKELEKVESELLQFHEAMKKSKTFSSVMKNPTIKKSIKVNALREMSNKMSFSPLTGNTLALVADNGRITHFNSIMKSFKTIMAAHRGEVNCKVTSAKPLSNAELKDIEGALKKISGDKKIILTTSVNPELIGGLVVLIGDKYVDMSIASKIKLYTDVLKSVM